MRILSHAHTDVGRKRDHNEDRFLVDDELGLFVVCDGMGGHEGGEIAAECAINVVHEAIRERRNDIVLNDDRESRERAVVIVRNAVEEASAAVYALATGKGGKAGMGTTLTLVVVDGARGIMAHVGDSRLYLGRGTDLHQLSEDHSYVAEMVRRGMISPERAKDGPYSNVITRAIGIQRSVQVDTLAFDILSGDTYLLCSDGLHRYFEDDTTELATLLMNDNVETLAGQLVDISNERGGRDNITSLVLRAERDDESADLDHARSTEVNLRLETLRYVSLFRHLTMKELVQVLDGFRVLRCDRNERVISENEIGRSLYVILEGEVAVMRGGKEIARLHPGEHFGEMSLLNSRPRSATVKSVEESRLLVMDQNAFEELLRADPVLGVKFLWTFAQVLSLRLDSANEEFAEPPPFR